MNAGECVHCGALNRLDAAGACPACAGKAPCAKHPERASVARCSGCGTPCCRPCAPFGICDACAATLPQKGPAPKAAAPAPAPARRLDRRTFFVVGLSVLSTGLGALLAQRLGEARDLAVQADQAARLQAVWREAVARRYPADAKAFPPALNVVGPADPPRPHAVLYEAKGQALKLRLYDAQGQLVVRDGGVWTVTGF